MTMSETMTTERLNELTVKCVIAADDAYREANDPADAEAATVEVPVKDMQQLLSIARLAIAGESK